LDSIQSIGPGQVFTKSPITGVCGITFEISSSEPVTVVVMEEANYNLFAANSYRGSYLALTGSQCEDALACSRSVTLSESERYVWAVFNLDLGNFFSSGDTAIMRYDFDTESCSLLPSASNFFNSGSRLVPGMLANTLLGAIGLVMLVASW